MRQLRRLEIMDIKQMKVKKNFNFKRKKKSIGSFFAESFRECQEALEEMWMKEELCQ